MKKIFLILVFLLNVTLINGQTLSAARSTDWTLAGLRDTVSPSNIIVFSGDITGATDVSAALQLAINNAPNNSIIQFDAGTYKIENEISLKSFVTLRGMGAGKTILNFDLGGLGDNCLIASGSEGPDLGLASAASKEGYSVSLSNASSVSVGDYIRFIQDDADLVNDSWAERRTGQVSQVVAKSGNNLTLGSPLRMDFPMWRNPRVKRMTPNENIGVECMTIHRVDQVLISANRNKASKIKFNRVVNSWVKGVESSNCNYSHFEALYSANLLVSGCYFHDAFEYGTGGRAYGVMLHFATSESKVENTIFDNLRHAMIVQVGANGNAFAYNSSTNARDENGSQDEDMVCHGNYAYLNLFESNVCEAPSVDASHGENGPYNTYFRNRATKNGFNVTFLGFGGFVIIANSNQNFIGNEGSSSIGGSGHVISFNSWQSPSGSLESSLAYSKKPEFLKESEFGEIGYGNFSVSASNAASGRYYNGNYINTGCGYYVWEGSLWRDNFVPDINSENYNARIWDGSVCTISANTELKTVEVEPGGRLELSSSNTLDLDSLWLKSNATSYSQFKGDANFPTIYEMTISNPGWHLVSVPLASGTIAQAEDELLINYSGNANGASIYEWDANAATYNPIVNNSESVSLKAFNIYADDAFVKTGKGINKDGKLPVKLTFKGIGNNGSVTNSTMGYATAGNAMGDPNGWNLIFNPYPCSIDLDVVFGTVEPHYQIGTHLLVHSEPISYEIRTTTAVNNGNQATIAPGQSFFVKLDALADLNAGYFDFDNSVRTVLEAPDYYKTASPSFKLILSKDDVNQSSVNGYLINRNVQGYSSELDISGNWIDSSKAIIAFEKDGFSEKRLLSVASVNSNQNTIRLSFYAPQNGNYSIEISNNDFEKKIYLRNLVTKKEQLLSREVEVYLKKGWTKNKFEVVFDSQGPEDEVIYATYYFNEGFLFLTYPNDANFLAKASLMNLDGKILFENDYFESKGRHEFKIDNLISGVYILQLYEGGVWKSTKVLIGH